MEKYIKNNCVAVLVSHGYGAGWSTSIWGDRNLAVDKRVVEFYLQHKDDKVYMDELCNGWRSGSNLVKEVSKLFKSWGYENTYFGGFGDIEIEWVPIGTAFRIQEDDGNEWIEYMSNIDYVTA